MNIQCLGLKGDATLLNSSQSCIHVSGIIGVMLYVFRITGIYVKDLGQMGRADIVYMQDGVSQGLIQTRENQN